MRPVPKSKQVLVWGFLPNFSVSQEVFQHFSVSCSNINRTYSTKNPMNFNSTAISIKLTSVRLSFEWDFIHSLVRIFSNFFFFCLLFILKCENYSDQFILWQNRKGMENKFSPCFPFSLVGDKHIDNVFVLYLIPIITPPHFSLNPTIM